MIPLKIQVDELQELQKEINQLNRELSLDFQRKPIKNQRKYKIIISSFIYLIELLSIIICSFYLYNYNRVISDLYKVFISMVIAISYVMFLFSIMRVDRRKVL